MPQIKKYDDEFRMKCFDLYCEGHSPSKIAKTMGVTNLVIKRLKLKRFPMNWEQGRRERVSKKTKKLENLSLESLEKVRIRIQNNLIQIQEAALKAFLRKIENDEVDAKTLTHAFFKAIEEEQKLHVPLDVLYGYRLPKGAVYEERSVLLDYLNERYEVLDADDAPDRPIIDRQLEHP